MDNLTIFPDTCISGSGLISVKFLELGIDRFQSACRYVHELPYGYNTDRDDLLILFREGLGSCTTKHAVIATLAEELGLAVVKNIGIYRMTEDLVTGTARILEKYRLPNVPMLHCFLVYDRCRVDLTEGNNNGKNKALEEFLYTEKVIPNISARDEYQLYRSALKEHILPMDEFAGISIKRILQAREEGLALLKAKVA